MPPPILAFDIETVPDIAGIRKLHALPDDLADDEVVDITRRRLRQERGSDFFPLPLQRVAVISCALRQFIDGGSFKIFSLPAADDGVENEAAAIGMFHRVLDKYQPTLVSWNGGGFDLPVLQYRGMMHRQRAVTYWKTDGDHKWNNYTNRFHDRHTDLMDILALYQARANARLDDIALLCGLPGKIGIGGAAVWDAWQQGDTDSIRRYCEHDALLTYLLYARHQHCRGHMDIAEEEEYIRRTLAQDPDRWQEFLTRWPPTPPQPPTDGMLL